MFRSTAHIYDLIYDALGKDYLSESSVIHELIQTRNPGARSLLDVACGTGGHLRYLQQWYTVTGVDSDPAMLTEARKHLPDSPLIESDMRTLNLGERFDAVTCLFSSIGYMESAQELDSAIRTMVGHLNQGGVFVLDGWVRPDAWIDGGSTHVEVAENGPLKVARVGRSLREGSKTLLEMHHLVASLEGIEHLIDHHRLTLFSPEEYGTALQGAGLSFEVVESPMPGRDRYLGVKGPS